MLAAVTKRQENVCISLNGVHSVVFLEAQGFHKGATGILGEEPAGPETIPGQEVRPEAALPLLRSFGWQLEQWRVASADGFG